MQASHKEDLSSVTASRDGAAIAKRRVGALAEQGKAAFERSENEEIIP